MYQRAESVAGEDTVNLRNQKSKINSHSKEIKVCSLILNNKMMNILEKFDSYSLKEEMVNLGLAKIHVDFSKTAIEKAESIFTEKEIEANGAILHSLWNGKKFICGFLVFEGEKQIEYALNEVADYNEQELEFLNYNN